MDLKPIEPENWSKEFSDLMKPMTTPAGETIDLFKVHGHNPNVLKALLQPLDLSRLSLIEREAIVVRTLVRCENHYEKFYHKRMFIRCGGTEADLDGLLDTSPGAKKLAGKVQALALAVDDAIAQRGVSPKTLDKLSEWYDSGQVLEILYVISRYIYFTFVINTAQIQLEDKAEQISTNLIAHTMPTIKKKFGIQE